MYNILILTNEKRLEGLVAVILSDPENLNREWHV